MYDAGVVGPLEIVVAFSDGAALHEWDDESHDQARPGQASVSRRLVVVSFAVPVVDLLACPGQSLKLRWRICPCRILGYDSNSAVTELT